jgi:hypothetical protein
VTKAIEEIHRLRTGFSDSGDDDDYSVNEDYESGDTKLKASAPAERPKNWDWRHYGIVNDVRHQVFY